MNDPDDYATIDVPKAWHVVGLFSVAVVVSMAIVYVMGQRAAGVEVSWVLAVIVVVNTVAVYLFGRFAVRGLAELLEHLRDHNLETPTARRRVDSIMRDHPNAIIFAFVYATLLAACSLTIAPAHGTGLRPFFVVFVFSGSLMIGYALWAVIRFWTLVWQELNDIPFRLLNLSAPPLPALMRFNSRVVTLTAWISTSAVVGLALSGYTANQPIILFSLFAFSLVGATYVMPVVPISNRLSRLKSDELNLIEAQIERHVRALSDPEGKEKPLDDAALERLVKARDLVAEVRTLPPGGQVSVSAAAIATALPFLPSAVEYFPKLFE